ncbi:hypothetical protein [Rhodobacter capsulatus]|uniref:hypothetical protein n=1 Tax=Rhodobacter capsulatus TaxID=1061 RepID=UPI0003D389F0|nr:hypothetical protein [Rhodobacter capsulatus]ETD83419.1 hypothetical protein U716_09170 [Rhodobacter capsulatus B6]
MKRAVITTAIFLFTASALLADNPGKVFVIVGDFTADNPAHDKVEGTHIADLISKDILAHEIGFGDRIVLRAAKAGGYAAKPQAWVRDVTLSAHGGTAAHVPGFIASRIADFATVPLAEESELAWTLEELGHDLTCTDETHVYVITNGVSATKRTAEGLIVDKVGGTPLAGCASLTWVGLGQQGDHDLTMRHAVDKLFIKVGELAGAEDTNVLR